MEQNETMNFDTISAELGLPKNTQITSITARISELVKAESSLAEIKGELTATKIKLEGKEADLVNANKELDQVKAELQNYKDAEAAAREAEITAVVDDAISAGKIEASAKDAWIAMAKSDLETVKATLGSIQAREKITQVIAQDPENVENIEKTLEDVEAQMQATIKAHLGDVEFAKF